MLVTLSAAYGAGGSRVGPEVARRLGVQFLDRAIPVSVSEQLSVSVDEVIALEETPQGLVSRLLSQFARGGFVVAAMPTIDPGTTFDEREFQVATERAIRELAASGDAVILGRAASVVLRDSERALHVRLDGPVERRAAQAAEELGLDRATAERQLKDSDRAREAYVKHFYRVDPRDPSLYHLWLDSTRIPFEACVELIIAAARGFESRLAPPAVLA